MNIKYRIILLSFTALCLFSLVSRIYFNDFQDGWNAYVKNNYETALELWLPLAKQGNFRAQFLIGSMYDFGQGVPENDSEAFKWYQLAAEQGESRALLFLGFMYDFGQGVPEDDREAFKWYQLAAEQGYAEAKNNIYVLAKNDFPEALTVLLNDAKKGVAVAQYTLGSMYEIGEGVLKDGKEAVKWYLLAAEQNDYRHAKNNIYNLAKMNVPEALTVLLNDAEKDVAVAQFTLGSMYDIGQGVPKDGKEAVKWYLLAAEQNDYRHAKNNIYNLANMNVPEALTVLLNDAEKGIVPAQNNLSVMYLSGLGVPQDYDKFTKLHLSLKKQEFAQAKNDILALTKKNIPQELKTLTNNAEKDVLAEQLKLGRMYQFGLIVSQDDKKAVHWYRLAAEQGDANAQFSLGFMYYSGQGVPKDDQEATKWYRLAIAPDINFVLARLLMRGLLVHN